MVDFYMFKMVNVVEIISVPWIRHGYIVNICGFFLSSGYEFLAILRVVVTFLGQPFWGWLSDQPTVWCWSKVIGSVGSNSTPSGLPRL